MQKGLKLCDIASAKQWMTTVHVHRPIENIVTEVEVSFHSTTLALGKSKERR